MKFIALLFSFCFSFGLTAQTAKTRIAFGSCARQSDTLGIFDTIVKHHPTHFLFLGDNIYADTRDTAEMSLRYSLLDAHTSYQHLKDSTIIWATWDDHDFGENDAGSTYPLKKESKEIFMQFFNEPVSSKKRIRDGVYDSYFIKDSLLTIQVIMLDTRYFRDDLLPYNGSLQIDTNYNYTLSYSPHTSPTAQLLGEEQWKWLETELQRKADLRLICTSIQFAHSYNGFESWNNFPAEKKRFMKLLKKTKANGVLLLSGDVHYAEISKVKLKRNYFLYDFTSSGLSSKWHMATPNSNRIAGPEMENHFGFITFNKVNKDLQIHLQLITVNNQKSFELSVLLSKLQF